MSRTEKNAMKSAAIKRLRRKLGKTQQSLAEHVGVTRACVSQWESGARRPGGAALTILGQLEKTSRESAKSP
jgi:DNA-binding transcriptional regulator YiaG